MAPELSSRTSAADSARADPPQTHAAARTNSAKMPPDIALRDSAFDAAAMVEMIERVYYEVLNRG